MTDELSAAAAEIERLAREADELTQAAAESGTGLVPTGSNLPATVLKGQMAEIRAAAMHKQVALREAQEVMRRRMDAEMDKVRAALAPLQEMVARLEEGIWSVNLYLGRDEQIVTLAEGEPAPADTPIVLRQMVLNMDEESAIGAEYGGIDARTLDLFDDWLRADPAHVEQVIPEPKAVVVLRPRRHNKDYADPWLAKAMAAANAQSYWLIRNGAALYRVTTDLTVGDRLIPSRDEFTDFFTRRRYDYSDGSYTTVSLEPGSSEWLDAEKAADDRRRHFLRIGLVLQGLVDRTTVLHPLPAPTVSFLQPLSYDAGHIVLLADDDLAIGTGREPFRDWQRRLCAELRTGMRIIGAFNTEAFREVNRTADYGRYEGRVSPEGASAPPSEVIHYLEGRRDGGFYFLYKRTDKRWGYEHDGYHAPWGEWEYKKRASCTIYPDDSFILPFDLVGVEEMEIYLSARQDRHAYADLFPLLKAAIAAKRNEAELEAPFRTLLAGEILRELGDEWHLDVDGVEKVVPELVDWWKLRNKWHRPLVSADPDELAKALRMIVAEQRARLRTDAMASTRDLPTTEMIRRTLGPDVMLIARRRDGTYIAYTPADDRPLYVHEHTWTKTGRARPTVEWARPSPRWVDWTILHRTKRWDDWKVGFDPGKHLTGPELADAVEILRHNPAVWGWQADSGDPPRVAAITYDTRERTFGVFVDDLPEPGDGSRLLTNYRRTTYISRFELGWSRNHSRGNVELFRRERRSYDLNEKTPPWERRTGYGEHPVFTDEAVIFNLTARLEPHRALARQRHELQQVASSAVRGLLDEWQADALAMHYARFLEDFVDPDLWEGHYKTLRIGLPHDAHDALEQRMERVVEEGIDVDGWTVDTLDAVFQELEPDHDHQVEHRYTSFRSAATPIPEGFGHRVIRVAPPNDPDDND